MKVLPRLTFEAAACEFTASQLPQLRTKLRDLDRQSVLYPVNNVRDLLCVLPNPSSTSQVVTTATGDHFTIKAFYQICRLASPGLYRLVIDLFGHERTEAQPISAFSAEEAIAIYNQLVHRRFASCLAGKQLLKRGHTIEGIVGEEYQWISGSEVLERVMETSVASTDNFKFLSATMTGCRLRLRFAQDPMLSVDCGESGNKPHYYSRAMQFTNDETGEKAMTAVPALYCPDTGFALATDRFYKTLYHRGKQFDLRAAKLFSEASFPFSRPTVAAHLQRLRSQTLGWTGNAAKDEERSDKIARSIHRLEDQRRLRVCRLAVARAAAQSAFESNIRILPTSQQLRSRCVYDLLVALLREAQRLPWDHQESMERAAWQLFCKEDVL